MKFPKSFWNLNRTLFPTFHLLLSVMPKNQTCLLQVMTNLAYNMFGKHSCSASWQYVAPERCLISDMMIKVFCDMTPCTQVHSYQHFWEACWLHFQGTLKKLDNLFINTNSIIFRNTDLSWTVQLQPHLKSHIMEDIRHYYKTVFIHTWKSSIGEHSYLCYNMVPCSRGTQAF
jgi:hypothetical protein